MLSKIDQDLKEAIKNKDEIKTSALRNLKAELKNVEIEKQHVLSDDEVIHVIGRKVKQHRDSIESFKSGNRSDLVEQEEKQMAVLMSYLPQQLSESEIRKIISEAISSLNAGPTDFGKVMKEVSGKTRGLADGSFVSKIVKEELSK